MPTLRAQVVLPYLSGKPEDVAVNTFHFIAPDFSDLTVDAIRDDLVETYNVATVGPTNGAGAGIGPHLSNSISRVANAAKIKVYNLADAKPRPVKERSWTVAASVYPTAMEMPAEVALCGSFFAGRNLPRHRGRIYFGPFTVSSTADIGTFQRGAPTGDLINSVWGAMLRLANSARASGEWAVHSSRDNLARAVTAGWVDDAWDIQRRRGQDAGFRNPWVRL